jgi:predicted dehydrogenase
MAKMKAGVIGTGFVGAVHIEGIRRRGVGEVVAIAGSSDERAREKASELGIDRAYGNYMDLIRDPDVQVVHDCAPTYLRFPINRAALAEGKHVVSEIPMAANLREAKLLLNASERSKAVNAVAFNYRHHPTIAHLRSMVQAGELGKIYTVRGSYLQDWLLYETDYNWRVDSMLGGMSRVVADLGSHWCDLVQFVTDRKITEVIGDLKIFLPIRKRSVSTVGTFGRSITPRLVDVRVATEDYGSVLLRFENEMHGMLTLSQVSAGRKNRLALEIDGSTKSAAWNQEQAEAIWFGYRDQPNDVILKKKTAAKQDDQTHPASPSGYGKVWADATKHFIQAVYQYITEGKQPKRDSSTFATFVNGYEAAVVADRILASSRQRRWAKTNIT